MPIRSKSLARPPLMSLGIVELAVLFLSAYIACVVVFGSMGPGRESVGLIVPKAATLAIMMLVALAIRLEDGLSAPVIHRQHRVGHHGDVFDMLKFRSMRVVAEADGQAVWADADDPRVTIVGNIIRKLRFDELPQIFNVLTGQMSILGLRPKRPAFVAELGEQIPFYSERHTVQPGVTGWAQLKFPYGASVEDSEQKLCYDLYCVKNRSLLLDLMFILQTVAVHLWGKGAR